MNYSTEKQSKNKLIIGGLIGVGVVSLCVLVGVLGYFIVSSVMRFTGQENLVQLDPIPDDGGQVFSTRNTLPVAADGTVHTDEFGVSLTVPAGALEDEQQTVQLVAQQMRGEEFRELEQAFHFETPVYQVGLAEEMDGIGKAELRFPFEGDEAMLMVIIDGQYYSLLAQQPEDGIVKVHAHLGPIGAEEAAAENEMAVEESSIRYALLSPKQTAGMESNQDRLVGPALASASQLPLNVSTQQKDPQDCSTKIWMAPEDGTTPVTWEFNCRTNTAQSVVVNWRSAVPDDTGKREGVELSQAEADQLIQEAEKLVARFKDAGFTGAEIPTRWFGYSLKIVVTPHGEPQYNLKNGVIYLPLDSVRVVLAGSPPLELLHELAHWVQHKQYSLVAAAMSGARTWWIETSSEIMMFMVEPQSIDANMSQYGLQDGFTKSPFQWDETLYIHAHLIWVSMCAESAFCPLDQESFIHAINNGEYPFADFYNQEVLISNLDDYALYLLDHTPQRSNQAAKKNVKMGGDLQLGFGDKVNIASGPAGHFLIHTWGDGIQEISGENIIGEGAMIDVAIQRGGVYPITIASGSAWNRKSPLPAVLTIKPGAPFWLKIGDQEPVRYDGTREYRIQPISDQMGHSIVRVVALGEEDHSRFQATVGAIDLQGDWVITNSSLVSMTSTCREDAGQNYEQTFAEFAQVLSMHFAARGTYRLGWVNGDVGLVYEAGEGFSLSETRNNPLFATFEAAEIEGGEQKEIPYTIVYSGSIQLQPDAIEWKMKMDKDIAEDPTSSSDRPASGFTNQIPPGMLGLLVLLCAPGGIWLSISGGRRRKIVGLLLTVAAVSLSCVTIINFDMSTTTKLDQIEYLVPIDADTIESADATFRLTGQPVTTVLDATAIIPAGTIPTSLFGEEVETIEAREETCLIEIVSNATVEIYPDGLITDFDMFSQGALFD